MRPGYWGRGYFVFTWWRLKYWFENSVAGAIGSKLRQWGYRLKDLKLAQDAKKLREEVEALEAEAIKHEAAEAQALIAFTSVLKARIDEAQAIDDAEKRLREMQMILEMIEAERIAAAEAEELEELALILALLT